MEYSYINFLGSEIMAIINHDGEQYVAMRSVVDVLGLDWNSQLIEIKQRFKSSIVEITATGKDGKNCKMLCLPFRKLFGWLMTIDPDEVTPQKKETIIRYQKESNNALWQYMTTGKASIANPEEVL